MINIYIHVILSLDFMISQSNEIQMKVVMIRIKIVLYIVNNFTSIVRCNGIIFYSLRTCSVVPMQIFDQNVLCNSHWWSFFTDILLGVCDQFSFRSCFVSGYYYRREKGQKADTGNKWSVCSGCHFHEGAVCIRNQPLPVGIISTN